MPWYNNLIPDWVKKSVCSCLIKRYLSHYIENEVSRDQLKLDLYNGRATAERISLAVETINELGETQNWPFEFVDGYIDEINISVPWTSIFSDSTLVEICGMKITIQPKQTKEDATSMFESMWNSMTSSMHLAEEFVKEKAKESSVQPIEGIELFAQTIESVVKRIKVTFKNTIIQVEHLPKESEKGVGLLIEIELMKYYDETTTEDQNDQNASNLPKDDSKKAYLIDSFATKNILVEGITMSTIEFPSMERTFSRSLIREDSRESKEEEKYFEAGEENQPKELVEPVENYQTSEENSLSPDRHVIVFAHFCNRQEVRIKLKQSENISGPKISIEVNLGSLVAFLSPRQFHILVELIEGFSSPDLEDHSNVPHRNQFQAKPMTDTDYQKVEEQLGNMLDPLKNYQGYNLQQARGWSTGALDESTDSQYLPMPDTTSALYDSTISGVSSSMDSSMTSSMISSVTENASHVRRRVSNIDADPTAEISRFQIRLATMAVILLHEDLLGVHTGNEKILVKQMQGIAENFFRNINYNALVGLMHDGFEKLHTSFDNACKLSHLRLIVSPLQLEADEKTTSTALSMTGHIMAAKLELLECLPADGGLKHISLLNFKPSETASVPSSIKPNVKIRFKHVKRSKSSRIGQNNALKGDLSISLNRCSVDFDISIMDRITTLLNHPRICGPVKQQNSPWKTNLAESDQYDIQKKAESTLDFKVTCPLLDFKVRFPIPDYKPAHDLTKVPWWERNVRHDYLSLVLQDAAFHTVFQTNQSFKEYTIECKLLDVYYYESENTSAIHIGRAGRNEKCLSMLTDSESITRLCIKIFPNKIKSDEVFVPDPMTHSCYGAFENQGNPEPGPFGSKKIVHESDTPHSKVPKDEAEELVIPGDQSEVEKFIHSATSNAQILVELTFSVISLQLQSKHIYELLYNRINTDLLLWEPAAPKPTIASTYKSGYDNIRDFDMDDSYIMAKSGVQYESDSDASDDSENTGVFYSTYDTKIKRGPKVDKNKKKIKNGQCEFVMNLKIKKGLLCINPPVRDVGLNVIPGQQGELLLNLNDALIFIVTGYMGDSNLNYVSVQLRNAQLFHCDMQPVPSTTPPLREVGSVVGKYLFPTIYKSDEKTLACSQMRGGDRDMFTVAVKVQKNHETHHVKVITLSLGLNKATLRHKMGREPNTWISHLIDFFNVKDYPTPGYVPKDVLTELHLHLWDCAVDYRPLNLPIRSLITVGNFNLSSHLTALANTSTLRFIFEDCGFFLSEKAPPRNGVASNAKVDLARDYVNVVDLGLLEISIKINDKKCAIYPHLDLWTSNNMLKIRTCSDSARALIQLLTYYINDGDLNTESQAPESTHSSPMRKTDEELIPMEEEEIVLSRSQQEQISELLEEAMKENSNSLTSNVGLKPTGTKVFYFPDEKDVSEEFPAQTLPQVATDLGEINPYHFGRSSDTDEEFCIVGNETISELCPRDGVPEITLLTNEPVRILENHMAVPIGKRDVLDPPKGFPSPLMRYTICEMNVVWQMYGGNDFKIPEEDNKREVRFSEKQLSDKVSFSNTRNKVTITQAEDSRTTGLSWVEKGGVNRDHSVLMELQLNKVKLRHEIYPETCTEASRQVLSISDVEIRDRLSSSQMNKFLYQYFSQLRPKKLHSNMVTIKMLHIRPDPQLKRQECKLKISLSPIRLNIDQDSLLFLIKFFKELGGESSDLGIETEQESSSQNTPTHHPPVMTVSTDNEEEITKQAKQAVNENLILLESRYHSEPEENLDSGSTEATDDSPVYFRYVEFSKDVLIRLDYHGKRVDMSHGPVAGLLMGLGQLNCSELRLKRIVYRHGLLGFNKLASHLLKEWLGDIKKSQLPKILGGVGPMHAVIQLFQGVKDLFWLPIEQYQKDGRIVRGLQRGANSFTTSTAMAALELTTRIIYFIQITAETAYDMLSPGPSIRMKRLAKQKTRKKRHHQPQDLREGITNAYNAVKEGIGETADNIVQLAAIEKEQKGISGAVGAVIRQIPPTMLKPVLIASEATTNILGGMQSQLAPDIRKEANEKWRNIDL